MNGRIRAFNIKEEILWLVFVPNCIYGYQPEGGVEGFAPFTFVNVCFGF